MPTQRCHRLNVDGKSRCRRVLAADGTCPIHGEATYPAAAQVAAANRATVEAAKASKRMTMSPSQPPWNSPSSDGQVHLDHPELVRMWRSKPDRYWTDTAAKLRAKVAQHEAELEHQPPTARTQRLMSTLRRDLNATRLRLCEDRGSAAFPDLYDRDGRLVNARYEQVGHTGTPCWYVYPPDDPEQRGRPTRVDDTPDGLAAAGYERRTTQVPAWAKVVAPHQPDADIGDTLAHAKVLVFRIDQGRPFTDPERLDAAA